jgi:MerR family transcriptional regulator, copper efflux regulator
MSVSGVPIGELSRRTGLSADSLRHYERLGLLPPAPRSAGGARRFPVAAERQVRIIQTALGMGFTLRELADVFIERRSGGAPCRKVYALASAKLEALERRLRELHLLRDALATTLGAWRTRLQGTDVGVPAALLETLTEPVPLSREATAFPRKRAAR